MPSTADAKRSIILMVDDNDINLRLLGTVLREAGYQVAGASSGAQALAAAPQLRPDLVLLDVAMPAMDGYEVCRRLKASEATKDTPVLFLTAHSETGDLLQGFAAGGQDYITKPFQNEELLARVATHLELKRSRDLLARYSAELARLNADKDKFFSIIAHDLKAPFSGFIGLTEMLSTELDMFSPDEIKRISKQINEAGQNLYQLIENLLDWSRLHTGRMEFDPHPLKLPSLVQSTMDLFKPGAAQKGVKLVFDSPSDVACYGDEDMIATVVRNLVGNALKFSHSGTTVTVTVRDTGEMAEVEVADQGIGMSANQLEQIFSVGAPKKSVGTAGEKGTGLGLALCDEMARTMGGSLSAESEEGKGSVFTLSLHKPPEQTIG
jgi:two-component system, sensor histidine kinase and response regulator